MIACTASFCRCSPPRITGRRDCRRQKPPLLDQAQDKRTPTALTIFLKCLGIFTPWGCRHILLLDEQRGRRGKTSGTAGLALFCVTNRPTNNAQLVIRTNSALVGAPRLLASTAILAPWIPCSRNVATRLLGAWFYESALAAPGALLHHDGQPGSRYM